MTNEFEMIRKEVICFQLEVLCWHLSGNKGNLTTSFENSIAKTMKTITSVFEASDINHFLSNDYGKSQFTFCVIVKSWPHSDIHIWDPPFWTRRTLGS